MKPLFCFFDTVTSTNSHIVQMPSELLKHGFCISVDKQTQGRGQQSNSWTSESKKNLLFSVLLRPTKFEPSDQFLLLQLVSVSVANFLTPLLQDEVTIKWPNDIYVGDRKLAGILIENNICGYELSRSVVGIGLNVNQMHFPAKIPNAVSLKMLTGKSYNRLDILEGLVQQILDDYDAFDINNAEELRSKYSSKLYRRLGYHPFKRADGSRLKAKISGIEPQGVLVLEKRDKSIEQFYFKEVSYVI